MSQREIDCLEQFIKQSRFSVDGMHAAVRMKVKDIPPTDLVEAIKSGSVIEIRNTWRGVRALLRHGAGLRDICVVVSLGDGAVVTAWVNNPQDQHASLDKSRYTWEVDVEQLCSEALTHGFRVC